MQHSFIDPVKQQHIAPNAAQMTDAIIVSHSSLERGRGGAVDMVAVPDSLLVVTRPSEFANKTAFEMGR